VKLFLLPPGGSSASLFRTWPGALKEIAEVVAVELPGRGTRFAEPLRTSLPELVAELVADHTPRSGEDWAVVGHSMGALLAAGWAAAASWPPGFLVVSASAPPWLHSPAAVLLERGEDLWEQIDALGGLPAAICGNPVARRLFSPILEADVKASASYRPACPEPVACPVTAVRGVDDDLINAGLLEGWSALTARKFETVTLLGGHFFQHGIDDLIPVVTGLLQNIT
jgi:surfactin synthase thioesterase subunit